MCIILAADGSYGVFRWEMLFDWVTMSEQKRGALKPSEVIRTPAMAGGLFLMRRDYFYSVSTPTFSGLPFNQPFETKLPPSCMVCR